MTMPWWMQLYLVGIPVPLLAVVAWLGWKAGREEADAEFDQNELRRLMFPYGVLWPLALLSVALIFVVGPCAVALGHWSKSRGR